jgi:hypothetical protein
MEPWGLIKSSAQNKVVHMKLSLCVSLQLSLNLGGYTMGTTTIFRVTTMEALTPWHYHRIL